MLIADLHIHSKYSRATSTTCDCEHLDLWARKKGITVLGTGDFTHPAWRAELKEKLQPAEEGFYSLKPEFRLHEGDSLSAAWNSKTFVPRFVISGEISSIYKKDDKVRKVHNLILLPGLEAAEELSRRLEAIGNIHSDGRPILGLDSRDLLEITLDTCPQAIFIPAHIWTPHFSMFGAFSGFDTVEACFGDLAPHIHALETGLSSDPPMNWRLSALDGYTLVSNSDAHSPAKLGREANLLNCDLSYTALKTALEIGQQGGFMGTIEFFPEEGKYHFDGHRKCHMCLAPKESIDLNGRCPVCGRKLTIGVSHRVEDLADRPEGFRPEGALPFESLSPLPEVIAAATGLSVSSKKTAAQYEDLLQKLGPEFYILRQAPLEDVRETGGPCLAEGIRRLRAGEVQRIPGYDGEYGNIKLLDENEISAMSGQVSFLPPTALNPQPHKEEKNTPAASQVIPPNHEESAHQSAGNIVEHEKKVGPLDGLNPEQFQAVTAPEPTVAVVAGPGTGKTKTLISRILYLVERLGVKPGEITAVTFTRQAAQEMRDRLQYTLTDKRAISSIHIGTFHSICMELLEKNKKPVILATREEELEIAQEILDTFSIKLSPSSFLQDISRMKNGMAPDHESVSEQMKKAYCQALNKRGLSDFDDLLYNVLLLWTEGKPGKALSTWFQYLLVDEFQDINAVQYQLVHAWHHKGKSLFVIGDPDQSIYGFRGSKPACFDELAQDIPNLKEIYLTQNYRSTPEILDSALAIISQHGGKHELRPHQSKGTPVRLLTSPTPLSEGIFVAKEINRMVGGMDMLDAGDFSHHDAQNPRGFSDIAILYRTHRQAEQLEFCLRQEGIPYIVTGREDWLNDPVISGTLHFFRFLTCPQDAAAMNLCLRDLWNCTKAQREAAENIRMLLFANTHPLRSKEAIQQFERFCEELPPEGSLGHWVQLCVKYLPYIHKERPLKLLEAWRDTIEVPNKEAYEKLLCTAVFHKTMDAFLQTILQGSEQDLSRTSGKIYHADAVRLMTLHGSKGLEFPVVFLCGVNQGCIPMEAKHLPGNPDEERRLFYVGMTRAKEELILLSGKTPSVFLDALPKEVYRGEARPPSQVIPLQISMFD